MHRGNFRPKRQAPVPTRDARELAQAQPAAPKIADDLAQIREQIANLGASLSPLKASVESLAAPKPDITVPGDIAKSLQLVHGRLDRLERQQQEAEEREKRAQTAFSNAILKLADKIEKISGGEDSSFSLAHSLERLIQVLSADITIKRNRDGDITGLTFAPDEKTLN